MLSGIVTCKIEQLSASNYIMKTNAEFVAIIFSSFLKGIQRFSQC